MSDVEWDADDYVPPPPPKKVTDKWIGEDEEDAVKESWEDDDEKNNDVVIVVEKKKKKKLADIIAEKERKKMEEMERRKKEKEEEQKKMTPEGHLAEKMRIQKVQEEADLALMSDLVGDEEQEDIALDDYDLNEKNGLEGFRKALVNKIRSTEQLEKELHFVTFVEELSRDLCQNMESDDIKRVTSILNALYNEKVKGSKAKSKKKAAASAKLNLGKGTKDTFSYDDYGGEFDDFI